MLTLLNPIDNPNDYNVISINGKDSPGLCTISEPTRSWQWDIKVGRGSYGSTTTFTGRVPAKFTASFKLWKRAHFAQWEEFISRLKYDPKKIIYNPETLWTSGVPAYDIFHPSLVSLDIVSAVIEDIVGLTHTGKGMQVTKISMIEWYPPPKLSVISTPAGATPVEGVELKPRDVATRARIAAIELDIQSKFVAAGLSPTGT